MIKEEIIKLHMGNSVKNTATGIEYYIQDGVDLPTGDYTISSICVGEYGTQEELEEYRQPFTIEG